MSMEALVGERVPHSPTQGFEGEVRSSVRGDSAGELCVEEPLGVPRDSGALGVVPCWRSVRPAGRIHPSEWSAILSDRVDCYWSLHPGSRQGFHYSCLKHNLLPPFRRHTAGQ